MSKTNAKSKALAMGLKEDLGPYATKFAEYVIDGHPPYDEHLEEILTKKWDGAVPKGLVWTEEVSRSIMGILFTMLDFAVEEAEKRKDFDESEEGIINYHVEPYYDDVSTMLVIHKESKTVLLRMKRKTYYFDPEAIESDLKEMVEKICGGIELVRKRQESPFQF